jgi:hypothetical protein
VNLPEGGGRRCDGDVQIADGATLMRDGLKLPCEKEFESAVIELNGAAGK